ncbi:hypothetical protein J6590_025069 [Homalodisca vitripennis]|nr:hypothetical protein J6590_025069 [Homalodisca vitripennis]
MDSETLVKWWVTVDYLDSLTSTRLKVDQKREEGIDFSNRQASRMGMLRPSDLTALPALTPTLYTQSRSWNAVLHPNRQRAHSAC